MAAQPGAVSRDRLAQSRVLGTVPPLQPKSRGPRDADGVPVLQAKFYRDGEWMQDVKDSVLTDKFETTTRALWSALKAVGVIVGVDAGGSGASYSFDTKTLQISADWLAMVKNYVESDTRHASLTRAIAALTHEMSHAHDHQLRGESPAGASREGDDWVVGVLKTELRAWMKEARSAREHARGKGLGTTTDDDDLVFSWVALKYMLDDGAALDAKSNVVIGRLHKYYNDNRTEGKSSALDVLLRDHLLVPMADYAMQIRAKFTSTDARLRDVTKKYMK